MTMKQILSTIADDIRASGFAKFALLAIGLGGVPFFALTMLASSLGGTV